MIVACRFVTTSVQTCADGMGERSLRFCEGSKLGGHIHSHGAWVEKTTSFGGGFVKRFCEGPSAGALLHAHFRTKIDAKVDIREANLRGASVHETIVRKHAHARSGRPFEGVTDV